MTQPGSFPGRPRGRRARHEADVPEGEGYAATPPDEREFPDLPPIRPSQARARDARGQGDWRGQPAQPGQYGPQGQGGQPAQGGYGAGYPAGGPGYGQSGPGQASPGYNGGQDGAGQYGVDQPSGGRHGGGQYGGGQHGGGQYNADQYSVGQHGADQYGSDQYSAGQYGGGPASRGQADSGQAPWPARTGRRSPRPGSHRASRHGLGSATAASPGPAGGSVPAVYRSGPTRSRGGQRRTCRPGPSPTRLRRSPPAGTGADWIPVTTGVRTGAAAADAVRDRRRAVAVIAVAVYFLGRQLQLAQPGPGLAGDPVPARRGTVGARRVRRGLERDLDPVPAGHDQAGGPAAEQRPNTECSWTLDNPLPTGCLRCSSWRTRRARWSPTPMAPAWFPPATAAPPTRPRLASPHTTTPSPTRRPRAGSRTRRSPSVRHAGRQRHVRLLGHPGVQQNGG